MYEKEYFTASADTSAYILGFKSRINQSICMCECNESTNELSQYLVTLAVSVYGKKKCITSKPKEFLY